MIIRELLQENGYKVILTSRVNQGIEKIIDTSPDLVICYHGLEDKSGFKVYKLLQPVLFPKDVPFVLYIDEFQKEDILIGLEMGIDSFILNPSDELAILKKIKNLIYKRNKAKYFDSNQFIKLFENSPVAKFVTENVQITMINKAFSELTGIKKESLPYPKIHDIFDFQDDEINRLNFIKLLNGLRNFCHLESVRLFKYPSQIFNIHMVYQENAEKNNLICELVPKCIDKINGAKFNNFSTSNNDKENKLVLTKREKEVLELSSKGLEIKQIANDLGISSRTVEKHRSNIMEKTKTNNIIEAINYFTTQYISSQN